jgi:hypothetical protein
MNEDHEPLETELFALRPIDASVELRRRIAGHRERQSVASRRRWSLVLAGGLAAACFVVVLLPKRAGRSDGSGVDVVETVSPRVEPEGFVPSLLAYHRALDRSPADLDDLLNRHARAASGSDAALVRTLAFTRSDSELQALFGGN